MRDRHPQPKAIRHLRLQRVFPHPRAGAVAAATIRFDQQLGGVRKMLAQLGSTPVCNRVDRKLRRIRRLPDVDRPVIVLLLDHKLVEFAASLPPHLKLRGLTRKYLLRKVSRRWLPPQILDRKKKGFPVPLSVWFRNGARSFLHDMLSLEAIAQRGLFDAGYVTRLLSDHQSGRADHGSLLWGLLSVELWYRSYIDVRPHPVRPISSGIVLDPVRAAPS